MLEFCLHRLFLLGSLFIIINASFKRVCYFSNWSQYRQASAKFAPSDIDPTLCTHIVYAFASMEGNKLKTLEENDVQLYQGVNSLKRKNANLKTLLGVGGWNFGTQKMTAMLATDHSRREFAKTTVDFLRKYDFDGIDLDFEYPGSRGSPAEDKQRYARLLQEIRQAFEEDAYLTGKPRLLLTAAVAAGKGNIDRGYDAKALARNLDFVNVMTYDLHGPWDKKVGHNSPMYAAKGSSASEKQLTVEWAANYWVSLGVPRHMLVIGLPTYGRCFTLQNPALHNMGDPITGPGKQGKFTRESGFLAYYEVCDMKKQGASVVDVWDNEQHVPYLYQGDQWVGYDNVKSLSEKVQWIRNQGFGGWMVWNLDLDDFTGSFCGEGKFPLISAMVRAAKGSGSVQSYQTQQTYSNTIQRQPQQAVYGVPASQKYQPPQQQSSFVPLTNEPYKPPQPQPKPVYTSVNYVPPQPVYTAPKIQPYQPPQNKPTYSGSQQPKVQQYQPQQPYGAPKVQLYIPPKPHSYSGPKVQKYQPYNPAQPKYQAPQVPSYSKQTYSAPKVEKPKPAKPTYSQTKIGTRVQPNPYSNPSMKPYDPFLQLSYSSPRIGYHTMQTTRRPIYQSQPKTQTLRQTTYSPQSTYVQPQASYGYQPNQGNVKNSQLSIMPDMIHMLDRQTKNRFNIPKPDPGYKWVILPVYAIHPGATNNINRVTDIDSISLQDLRTDLSYSKANRPKAFDTRSQRGRIAICTKLGPGIHAHPNEHCFKYMMCDHHNGYEMKCEHGTVYDPRSNVCQWPRLVPSRMHCTH